MSNLSVTRVSAYMYIVSTKTRPRYDKLKWTQTDRQVVVTSAKDALTVPPVSQQAAISIQPDVNTRMHKITGLSNSTQVMGKHSCYMCQGQIKVDNARLSSSNKSESGWTETGSGMGSTAQRYSTFKFR